MANEIAVNFQLSLKNVLLKDNYNAPSIQVDQTNADLVRNVQLISNTTQSILDLGGVISPGYGVFSNIDTDKTNFIQIGVNDAGGNFIPFLKLQSGDQNLVKMGTAAIYAKASTAPAKLFYLFYEE